MLPLRHDVPPCDDGPLRARRTVAQPALSSSLPICWLRRSPCRGAALLTCAHDHGQHSMDFERAQWHAGGWHTCAESHGVVRLQAEQLARRLRLCRPRAQEATCGPLLACRSFHDRRPRIRSRHNVVARSPRLRGDLRPVLADRLLRRRRRGRVHRRRVASSAVDRGARVRARCRPAKNHRGGRLGRRRHRALARDPPRRRGLRRARRRRLCRLACSHARRARVRHAEGSSRQVDADSRRRRLCDGERLRPGRNGALRRARAAPAPARPRGQPAHPRPLPRRVAPREPVRPTVGLEVGGGNLAAERREPARPAADFDALGRE